jgi:hypothetical protein
MPVGCRAPQNERVELEIFKARSSLGKPMTQRANA